MPKKEDITPTPAPAEPVPPADQSADQKTEPEQPVEEVIASGEVNLEGPGNPNGEQIPAEENAEPAQPANEPAPPAEPENTPEPEQAPMPPADPEQPGNPPAPEEEAPVMVEMVSEDLDIVLDMLEEWVEHGRTPDHTGVDMLVEAIDQLAYYPELQSTLRAWTGKMESPSGSTAPVGILREFCQYARRVG